MMHQSGSTVGFGIGSPHGKLIDENMMLGCNISGTNRRSGMNRIARPRFSFFFLALGIAVIGSGRSYVRTSLVQRSGCAPL